MQAFGVMLARPKGFEPLTHGLEGRCSIQLSYGRTQVSYYTSVKEWTASPDIRKDGF